MTEEKQEPEESNSEPEPLYCGVDVGAAATKLVMLDANGRICSRVVQDSGVDYALTRPDLFSSSSRGLSRPLMFPK